ncbi:hypothetical protein DFH09DRAFT_1340533 [Mycena vulgaris]|nr:hypothetical protein DFH09DRAFT_1340533 [Mycena vulgaris]
MSDVPELLASRRVYIYVPTVALIINSEVSSKLKFRPDAPVNAVLKSESIPAVASRQVLEYICIPPFTGVDALDKSEPTKKAKRAPKQSEAERKQVLESNLAISVVQPHRVKCGGCNQWIQLHGEQTYKVDNWDRHEKKCSNIIGVRRIRTVIKQSSLRPVAVIYTPLFGLARMMLPNFTYAEFLKIVQHVMVRQRILLSSSFKEKRERKASLGYVLDFDASPLTPEDLKPAHISVSDVEINSLVELAFQEAASICTQLLHIPAPTPTNRKPVRLTPLGAPARKPKASQDDSEDDSDPDVDDDEEEAEEDEVEVSDARDVELAARKLPSKRLHPFPLLSPRCSGHQHHHLLHLPTQPPYLPPLRRR